MATSIKLEAHAKINLTLDVLGKRQDGYHDVEMIMQQISLHDLVTVTIRQDQKIMIQSSDPFVPIDETNLAYKAARLMQETFSLPVGFDIYIEKHIPIAAGLAGGSTDAAAVMKGINHLLQLTDATHLEELGVNIGADVPFCIRGGAAIARGLGEELETIQGLRHTWLLLVKPNFGVATKEVYMALNINDIKERPDTKKMVEALKQGNKHHMMSLLCNVLETATLVKYPEVNALKKQMISFGADGVLMSGSGPTVFGFFKNENRMKHALHNMKRFYPQSYMVMTYNGEIPNKGE
jgi:4-diphosphocytidyl-2-C-methyl-D-erythritol kinase